MKPHVLIIGAGISGLSTALALSRKGVPVRVFERAEELQPLGAGLSLWSNAMRFLQVLGIADRLTEAGSVVERLQFRTKEGEVLKDIPLGRLSEKFGAPTICVHRADLQRTLLQPLGHEVVVSPVLLTSVSIEASPQHRRSEPNHHHALFRRQARKGARGSCLPKTSRLWRMLLGPFQGGRPAERTTRGSDRLHLGSD